MRTGDLAAGRFEIERLAGSGGMGSVYAARDRVSGERVALKVVRDQLGPDNDRLLREARTLAELEHPNIVRHVADGVMESGEPFLAMEWLEGEDLEALLRRGSLPVDESLALIMRVADALGSAHARGIIHRDIKPSNLFIPGGRLLDVKVLDFGIARAGAGQARVTRTGAVLGTLGYMAPEQATAARSLDARADVFSLGCVLFECVAGRPAFAAEQLVAVLTKVLFEDPPRLRELCGASVELDELVARMLQKQPEARPANAAAVVAELRALTDGKQASAARAAVAALTRAEQSSVSIVLAAPQGSDAALAETREADAGNTTAKLRQGSSGVHARIERLAGGALAVVISGAASATDQAAHAARAALAIRDERPNVPIALVTGRALLGGAVPVGEAIDRAARLLAGGKPGIVIDEATAGLLDASFAVGGDAERLELQAERGHADETRTLLGHLTPFVGRDRELAFLEALIDECVAEPLARVVLVTAPPGAGKSRLRRELLTRLGARGPAWEVWIARADPMSEGSPFGMLAHALRHACGVSPSDAPELSRIKLSARVSRHVAPHLARTTAEFLGEILGVRFPDEDRHELRAAREDPIVMGDRMREAWLELASAECKARPLAIVLEDLHWGDLPTVSYIDAALAQLRDQPLLVLTLARPEVHRVFPKLWAERELQELKLGALTRSASGRLVRDVLGAGIDVETVTRLTERSGGNAFFLEELIRAHAEGKGQDAPETVLAMLQARLGSMDPESRRVLRAASVFGEAFPRDGVQALLGSDVLAHDLDAILGQLVEREVLVQRGDYAFRHALLRDAAYAMLTDSDCMLGHRLAGDFLERSGAHDAIVLAEHFERGASPERALSWFERAAEQALEGNDLQAAIGRAERGIACGATGVALGALRYIQAAAHDWRGENLQASRAAVEALENLPLASEAWFKAACELAVAYRRLLARDDLHRLGEAVCVIGATDAVTGACLRCAARTVIQLLIGGAADVAIKILAGMARHEQAILPLDPGARAWVLAARAMVSMLGGDPTALVGDADAIIQAADESGDRRSACNVRLYIGIAAHELGAFELAERLLREAISIADMTGFHTMSTTCRSELADTLNKLGRSPEARAIATPIPNAMREQNDRMQEANSRTTLGRVLLAEGEAEAAESEARRALELMARGSPFLSAALALLADTQLARGAASDALSTASRAVTEMSTQKHAWAGGYVHRVYIEALRASGDYDGARRAVDVARTQLLARASGFRHVQFRAPFLKRVPDNARIAELAAELEA